jgi:hypothetical protein
MHATPPFESVFKMSMQTTETGRKGEKERREKGRKAGEKNRRKEGRKGE